MTKSPLTLLTLAVLVAAIAGMPIAWGGVLPEGKLAIQLFAFAAALLASLTAGDRGLERSVRPLGLLCAIAVLGVVQILPMSRGMVAAISATSAAVWDGAAAALELFGREAPAHRISIAPTDTLVTTLLVLAYAALFFASARTFCTRPRRRVFFLALFAVGVAQTVYATLSATSDRPSGSFVNPNHLAGYLEIVLAMTFGGIVYAITTGGDRAHAEKDRLDQLYRRWVPVAWAVVAWAVIAIGIAITRSRGGIMMATVTTIVMLTMAVLHGRSRLRRTIAAAEGIALLGGLGIVAMTTGTYPLLRFLTSDPRDAEADMRVQLWRHSIEAWKEFPLLGSGLGSFREAFRRVQPDGMNALVEQAHNDGLQLLVTGGIVGFLLGASALLWMLVLFARAFSRQHHREEAAWALAGFGALLSLLLHGLVEFNFSIPAIPATLAIMLGCAWAAASTESAPLREAPRQDASVGVVEEPS